MAPTDRFESTEAYYARYRPGYGDPAIQYLVDRFALDADARVLDLGCGAGQLTVPLAAHAGEVVGMDPNEAMLAHARDRATEAGVDNVEWVVGSDTDLREGADVGPLRLTTIGRAFHWMDGRATVDYLQERTESDGGVAILSDEEWLTHGRDDWQAIVHAVADAYVDDQPEREHPDDIEYEDPWDELLSERGLVDVTSERFPTAREWTVDEIVGYCLSLSFCSPAVLGDDREAFETDLRARLAEAGDEPFVQHVEIEVLSGRVP
ncbi:class I SAM-dependent methyltransferase [Halorarius litoreus]|uniref:class I SAM-dependent methyltransferase n=1 Tax=Halorarius litoreus TaxID=2962676 RepID=UPI0020CE542A|nr:class I SAM-dependent methyltransferase [Halorarius litoreus]